MNLTDKYLTENTESKQALKLLKPISKQLENLVTVKFIGKLNQQYFLDIDGANKKIKNAIKLLKGLK